MAQDHENQVANTNKTKRKEILNRWNLYDATNTALQICTDGLVGNLRLWSVQEPASRHERSSKAYTKKQ